MMINDKSFLKQLDLERNKNLYAKIIALDLDENPIEQIEGKILPGGGFNIDGQSAVRRTCSLTIQTDREDINNYNWALKHKFKVFIGIENNINEKYDDIIWFKQGIYVITSFSLSRQTKSLTVSIQGQDKMCLLNGTISGNLPCSVDFQKKELYDNSYEPVSFGQMYVKDKYYTFKEDNFVLKLDDSEEFSEYKTYYVKNYAYYQKIFLSKDEFDTGKYYILNTELYHKAETFNANEIYYYLNEFGQYKQRDILIEEDFEKYKDSLYTSTTYKKLEDYSSFNEYEKYYILNDNKQYQLIIDPKVHIDKNIYVENIYLEATEEYDETQMYFERIEPDSNFSIDKTANRVSYKPNKYFIYDFQESPVILSKEEYYNDRKIYFEKNELDSYIRLFITEENFDPKEKYFFQIGEVFVENPFDEYTSNFGHYYKKETVFKEVFFNDEYKKYLSNTYYIYDEQKGFILDSENTFNPEKTYYKKSINKITNDIPIKTIIREMIHTFGQEPYHNIIINDVDDYGLLLKEYRGEEPLYLLLKDGNIENVVSEDSECYTLVLDKNDFQRRKLLYEGELQGLEKIYNNGYISEQDYINKQNEIKNRFIIDIAESLENTKQVKDTSFIIYDNLLSEYAKNPTTILLVGDDTFTPYTVAKLEYGDAAGYEITELTYPGELNGNAGETITSILDKIKNIFSSFEYFYDIDGRFIFQKRKNASTIKWNNIIKNDDQETYVDNTIKSNSFDYNFENNEQIISISRTPKLNNVRNDFCVWGSRQTSGDSKQPILGRLAIDKKPVQYVSFPLEKNNYEKLEGEYVRFRNKELVLKSYNNDSQLKLLVQNKYFSFNSEKYKQYKELKQQVENTVVTEEKNETIRIIDDFLNEVSLFPIKYKNEMYAGVHYNIIFCDWREIIYQMAKDYYMFNQEDDFLVNLRQFNPETCQNFSTGYERYYVDLYSFWRENYDLEPEVVFNHYYGDYETYYEFKDGYGFIKHTGWRDAIIDYSDLVCNFYLPKNKLDSYLVKAKETREDFRYQLEKMKNHQDEAKRFYKQYLNQLEEYKDNLNKLYEEKKQIIKEKNDDPIIRIYNEQIKQQEQLQTQYNSEKRVKLNNIDSDLLALIDKMGMNSYQKELKDSLNQITEEVTDKNGNITRTVTTTANELANQAVKKWAIQEASKGYKHSTSHACPVCGQGTGYSSIGFVAAAYAHGAGDATMLENCKKDNGYALGTSSQLSENIINNWRNHNGYEWEVIYNNGNKILESDLPIGKPAILIIHSVKGIFKHCALWLGDGTIVDSTITNGVKHRTFESLGYKYIAAAFVYKGAGSFQDKKEVFAIENKTQLPSTGKTTRADKMVAKAKELAWPLGTSKRKTNYKTGRPTDKYKKAFDKYINFAKKTKINYSDCGMALATIVRASGVDKDFKAFKWNSGYKDWKFVTKHGPIKENALKPGDIIYYKKTNGNQHCLMYLGKGVYAEAGREHRFLKLRTNGIAKINSKTAIKSKTYVIRIKE